MTAVVSGSNVVVVAAPGPQGPRGDGGSAGSLSAPVVAGGELDVTVTSNWGIDPSGNPYYDSAGAAPADAAIATLGADGHVVLTDTRGGAVTVAVTSVNGHTGAVVVLTKADVGLGNVDNTSNTAERAATATLTNKTLTSPTITTPTGLVKGDVGLSSVDNTSDASKPLSSAATTALAGKAATVHTHAESDVTNLVTDLAAKLVKASNLADLPSASTARTNLGLAAVAGSGLYSDLTGTPPGSLITIPADKTTDYTLVLGDANSSIGYNSASAGTVTLPPNSSVAIPIGSLVEFRQVGAGRVAVAAGAGVTMRAADGYATSRVQYSAVSALKIATDTWSVSGDVAA